MADSFKHMPEFNPNDYATWRFEMEAFLHSQNIFGATNQQAQNWIQLDAQERHIK